MAALKYLVLGRGQLIGVLLHFLHQLGAGFGLENGSIDAAGSGPAAARGRRRRAGNIEADGQSYQGSLGGEFGANVLNRLRKVVVGISVALLQHSNQRVEVVHIGLSDFEKTYCQ